MCILHQEQEAAMVGRMFGVGRGREVQCLYLYGDLNHSLPLRLLSDVHVENEEEPEEGEGGSGVGWLWWEMVAHREEKGQMLDGVRRVEMDLAVLLDESCCVRGGMQMHVVGGKRRGVFEGRRKQREEEGGFHVRARWVSFVCGIVVCGVVVWRVVVWRVVVWVEGRKRERERERKRLSFLKERERERERKRLSFLKEREREREREKETLFRQKKWYSGRNASLGLLLLLRFLPSCTPARPHSAQVPPCVLQRESTGKEKTMQSPTEPTLTQRRYRPSQDDPSHRRPSYPSSSSPYDATTYHSENTARNNQRTYQYTTAEEQAAEARHGNSTQYEEEEEEHTRYGAKIKLSLCEEVLLMGLKDKQVNSVFFQGKLSLPSFLPFLPFPLFFFAVDVVPSLVLDFLPCSLFLNTTTHMQGYLSFWNDNISYVLRGCMLIDLALRGRIQCCKSSRGRPGPEKTIEVINEKTTGEVLLDECLRFIRMEEQSIANWIDLLSGKTRNKTSRQSRKTKRKFPKTSTLRYRPKPQPMTSYRRNMESHEDWIPAQTGARTARKGTRGQGSSPHRETKLSALRHGYPSPLGHLGEGGNQ